MISDLDDYHDASWQHAESHYEAGTDPEWCQEDDCPHWPAWWVKQAQADEQGVQKGEGV